MPERKQQSAGANRFHLFKQPGSRFYSMRVMVGGERRRFSTGETSKKLANSKAAAIMADIRSRGYDEAIRLHARRRGEVPDDPSIAEFLDIYRQILPTLDDPPARTSSERYIRSLERICTSSKIRKIRRLSPAAIARFKDNYLAEATQQLTGCGKGKSPPKRKRNSESARRTLNGILRNAAALFSKTLLAAYNLRGLVLENTFTGAHIRRVGIKAYSPLPRDFIDKIWTNSSLLRDGDESAPLPAPKGKRAKGSNAKVGHREFDFREPHPDAFAVLVLELGLGLRRNEADKAEWAWVNKDREGRHFLEVRETDLFKPKSNRSRIIPIEATVWELLAGVKDDDRFIVPGPKRPGQRGQSSPKSSVYRCERAHRILVAWLRVQGVDDPKPCHRLRKEFGSYVATSFGIFQAQRLLGHSSPDVTASYYANLTELPDLQPIRMGKPFNEREKEDPN